MVKNSVGHSQGTLFTASAKCVCHQVTREQILGKQPKRLEIWTSHSVGERRGMPAAAGRLRSKALSLNDSRNHISLEVDIEIHGLSSCSPT